MGSLIPEEGEYSNGQERKYSGVRQSISIAIVDGVLFTTYGPVVSRMDRAIPALGTLLPTTATGNLLTVLHQGVALSTLLPQTCGFRWTGLIRRTVSDLSFTLVAVLALIVRASIPT